MILVLKDITAFNALMLNALRGGEEDICLRVGAPNQTQDKHLGSGG